MNTEQQPQPTARHLAAAEEINNHQGCRNRQVHCALCRHVAAIIAKHEQGANERIAVLRHAVYVCDSKNHSLKNESYRAACDEIKISLLAAISRVEGGEQMESVAVCQSSASFNAKENQ